jgi:hypothetical protein
MVLCLAILIYRLLQYVKAPAVIPEDILGLPTTTPIPSTPIRSGSGGMIHGSIDDVDLNSESTEVI